MIYADNAATTKMGRTAIDAMLPYMDGSYGNPSSLYTLGQRAKEALEDARTRIAGCLGCEARELTFTSGSLDPSHVLLAIGRPHEVAHGSLRLTISEETTEEEADELIAAVKDVVAYLRSMSPVWRDLESGRAPHII